MLTIQYSRKETIEDKEIIDTTKRYDIFIEDLEIFRDNLLFRVGVGNSPRLRKRYIEISPHTELSRVLAEHGILGLFSIIFLLLWIFKRYRLNKEPLSKALIFSLALFGFVYTFHFATRLFLPAFFIGLIGADFKLNEKT